MVMVDKATRYVEVQAMKDMMAKEALRALEGSWIYRHGVPDVLQTDNGSNFTAKAFMDQVQRYGVRHHRTTPYNP
jgi:transposase InsO family protein